MPYFILDRKYGYAVYESMLHGVVETKSYLIDAADAGMTDDEREEFATYIAMNPQAGDMMSGCGGARKVRVRKPGSGKSGGYRVITYYGGDDIPVFLLTVFGKGDKVNLTKGERNGLAGLTKTLRDTYNKEKN